MHLDDRTLDELLAGELGDAPAGLARRHLAECPLCRARAAEIEAVSRSLATIDHPVPTVDVATVAARARARPRRARLLLAGAGATLAAALAAALPSSPLHQVLAHALESRPTPAGAPRAAQRGGSAIAIDVRHPTTRVEFRAWQREGSIRITPDTSRMIRIAEIGADSVRYAVAPWGVAVDNVGSAASYEVRLPAGSRVLILVGTDTVFVADPALQGVKANVALERPHGDARRATPDRERQGLPAP